tara:strand:+ start:1224 stop:2219 length:996 start_codon:yes stop_codon:yes gene_type:complete
MSKIRMNTEFRNKILNRYVDHAEKENTQEREAYLQSIEKVDELYPHAFNVATQVVMRSYPTEDVLTCKSLKKKYGSPLDVVAKDKCFYFSYAKDKLEKDEDEDDRNVSEHFDFGLFGDVSESSSYGNETGKQFAYAYKREELKAKECNADIFAQQNEKQDNPHKTKHIEANDKALGYSRYNSYNSENDNNIGMTKEFDRQYYLDIIGTSHCRSRTIACSKEEFLIFKIWKQAKANVITCHQKWIDSIEKQKQAMKTGLKAYRYLSEGVELMTELGITIDEAELVRVNSTGLTIYNPVNLASMIKGMKNTTMTREQKIALRMEYEKKQNSLN